MSPRKKKVEDKQEDDRPDDPNNHEVTKTDSFGAPSEEDDDSGLADLFGGAPDLNREEEEEEDHGEDRGEQQNPEEEWPAEKPSVFESDLSPENLTALNNQRKARALMEAEEIAAALFWKMPDNIQKRTVELIRIMNQVGSGNPRFRHKIARVMIEKFLIQARSSIKG